MRSVSKVNTSGDTSVTEVGQCRNNKHVTGQVNAGNIGMDKTSGNVGNCVHNVKLVENQNNVSGRSSLACNHGRDIQKVGGLNKEGATKQLAPTRLNTLAHSPTVTIGPICQDKGSVKDCDTRCEKKVSTLPSHYKGISNPDYMLTKKVWNYIITCMRIKILIWTIMQVTWVNKLPCCLTLMILSTVNM